MAEVLNSILGIPYRPHDCPYLPDLPNCSFPLPSSPLLLPPPFALRPTSLSLSLSPTPVALDQAMAAAAAECGPSNGLQRFKQHTADSVDRTLQQDHLSSRRLHPAQGFRSTTPNAAGVLDPEFEAFQAGVDLSLHDRDHQGLFQQPGAFGSPSHAPSWATDFQRMAISQPPAASMQHQQHFQPQASTSGWAQAFQQQHIAQTAPRQQNPSPSPHAFQQRARYGLTGHQTHFAQPNYAVSSMQNKGKAPVQAERFDEAAFAAAFDQAHNDLMADVTDDVQEEEVPTAQELLDELEADKFEAAVEEAATHILKEDGHDLDMAELHPMARVHGPDIEHETTYALREDKQDQIKPHHDDDALAATAEELLEKVKHNQSDKFRNSQFLALMRRLKDREVRVEGDKMVETVSPTHSPDATSMSPPTPITPQDYHAHYSLAYDTGHEWDHWESPY